MKKTLYILFIAIGLMSCKKLLDDINTDPTQFINASPEAVIAGAIKRTNDFMATNNTNRWWDIAHTICQQANRYDVADGGLWQNGYVNVLENLEQVISSYGNDAFYTNRVQVARIWKSYMYSILAGNYGPIPMSQANSQDHLSTILFDEENAVYDTVLNTLKDAAEKIDVSKDKLTYDVLYSGADGMLKWKKFANTLRLKIALRCTHSLGATALNHIREVMADEANTINAETETAKMPYENVNGNENPYFQKFVKNTFSQPMPKLSDFLLVFFRSYKDPRLGVYFDSVPLMKDRYIITDTLSSTLDDSLREVSYPVPYFGMPKSPALLPGWTGLVGINPLGNVNINAYSNPRADLYLPSRPFMVLSYAETLFLKAEVALLGLGGSRSAEQYYYSGIDANFAYWNINSSARDEYKARDGIKWGTTGKGFSNYLGIVNADIPVDDMNKIWIQSWLNYYPDQAFDVWVLQRRTRAIKFPPHTNPGSGYLSTPYADVPSRGLYPTSVLALNPQGYMDALQKLGTSTDDFNPYLNLKFMIPYTVPDWNNAPAQYDMRYVRKWYGNTIQDLQSAGIPYTVLNTFQ